MKNTHTHADQPAPRGSMAMPPSEKNPLMAGRTRSQNPSTTVQNSTTHRVIAPSLGTSIELSECSVPTQPVTRPSSSSNQKYQAGSLRKRPVNSKSINENKPSVAPTPKPSVPAPSKNTQRAPIAGVVPQRKEKNNGTEKRESLASSGNNQQAVEVVVNSSVRQE